MANQGPIVNFLRIFSRIITNVLRTVFVEPFPFIHSFYARASHWVGRSPLSSLTTASGKTTRDAARLLDLLEEATEPNWTDWANETCADAWATRGMVALVGDTRSSIGQRIALMTRATSYVSFLHQASRETSIWRIDLSLLQPRSHRTPQRNSCSDSCIRLALEASSVTKQR